MLLCKSKKVIRRKGTPFPESELSCFGQKKTFINFIQTLLFTYSFSLSLVFICRENPRRSGILLFSHCPRFCRLMKNIPDRLGWTGTNLENRERFYFPDASQISAMDGEHFQQMKTQIYTIGDVSDGFRSLPIP